MDCPRQAVLRAELLRAAEAHGAHPTLAELEAAWNDLIEPGVMGRLRSDVVDQLRPHLGGKSGEEIVDQQFLPSVVQARAAAKAAFEHFVECQARDQRSQRWSAAARLGWIVVGAIAGVVGAKLPDLLSFLTAHAAR